MATRDHKSYNEETFNIGVLGKEDLISKEEKISMQVKVETYAVVEAEMEIRYSDIALLYRTISVVFETQSTGFYNSAWSRRSTRAADMSSGVSNAFGHSVFAAGVNGSGKFWFFSLLTLSTFLGTFAKGSFV